MSAGGICAVVTGSVLAVSFLHTADADFCRGAGGSGSGFGSDFVSGTGSSFGSGTGYAVTGSGTGFVVTGSGTGFAVTGSGTGFAVTGSGTGFAVTVSGTGFAVTVSVTGAGSGFLVSGSRSSPLMTTVPRRWASRQDTTISFSMLSETLASTMMDFDL